MFYLDLFVPLYSIIIFFNPFDSYLLLYILCCRFLIKCFCDDFTLFIFFVKVMITDNYSTITQISQFVKITLHMSEKIRQKEECHFTASY